jgi:DNA repair protein RadD
MNTGPENGSGTGGGTARRFDTGMKVVDEIVSHFITHSFLDPNDGRVLETILNQSIAGTPLKVGDIIDREKLREDILRKQHALCQQEPEEFVVQPQDERVTLQKRLDERTKSVANRVLKDIGLARAGRDIGRAFQDARGKGNADALIILMNVDVNAAMDLPEGRRKDASSEKLRDAYGRLDTIGDALVLKIRTSIAQKKGKR